MITSGSCDKFSIQSSPVANVSITKSACCKNSISNDFKNTASSSTRKSFILFPFFIYCCFLRYYILLLILYTPVYKHNPVAKRAQEEHFFVDQIRQPLELFLPYF